MKTSDLGAMLAEALLEKAAEASNQRSDEEVAADLIKRAELMNRRYDFKPGDIVQYKPLLMDEKESGLFIVMRLLAEPIYCTKADSTSARFSEPLDIVLARISRQQNLFLEFHYDSRRFEPWHPNTASTQAHN